MTTGISCAAALLAAAAVVAPIGVRLRPPRRSWPVNVAAGAPVLTMVLLVATVAVAVGGLRTTTVLAGVLLAVTLTVRYRARVRRTRAVRESQAIVDALEVLAGELRVGVHPVRAFAAAAADTPSPVATALAAVAARAELGADVPAGLRAAARQSASAGVWERLGLVWELAIDNGLPVATLLHTVQADTVERQRFFAELDANLAGARATTAILAGLPALGVLLGETLGARPLALLLGGGFGGWLLVLGTFLVCAGLCWGDRITARVRG
jgi:tight adherence protein B